MGVLDKRRQIPSKLSGGERQRVAIARALVNRPKVILADEPTGNLDERTGGEVMDLLLSTCSIEGTSLILVTHNPSFAKATQKVLSFKGWKISLCVKNSRNGKDGKEKIACGVAGVGYLGQHHASIYHELDTSELIGFYEPNDQAAQKIKEAYNVKRFSSLEELAKECDAVSVVCPTDLHAKVAMPLLDHGCHLLVEKPFVHLVQRRNRFFPEPRKINSLYRLATLSTTIQ